MVTPIQPRLVGGTYSSKFTQFLSSAPASIQKQCAERKFRVCFEKGMRIVRVYNWDSGHEPMLEVVRSIGGDCPVFGKEILWNQVDCFPLVLPCPGNYEIRMPNNELLPAESVLEDQPITADVCACLGEQKQVYV